jgi:hypothetical protein
MDRNNCFLSGLICLALVTVTKGGPVALTGGGTVSANGHTLISIGQPVVGLVAEQPSGSPAMELGFVPAAKTCIADFNGDGHVTVQDIFDFLAAWFAHDPAADINNSGAVTVQDIFDFLAAWFAGLPSADFNHSGTVTVQDIFDFLAAWFAGCP